MDFEKRISDIAHSLIQSNNLKDHGWEHTLTVVEYSKLIINNMEFKLTSEILVAAYFHDVGRTKDGFDKYHALRSVYLIQAFVAPHFPKLDLDSIVFAVKHHSDMKAPNENFPVIQNYDIDPFLINIEVAMCLWDADRLDLLRVPKFKRIDLNYLNTEFAKKFANSEKHLSKYADF
ncbi:HD domain-containing protein [Candidatus Woesearchaeota archaeon]|nr:HD domain-containing protein [Candidatus Woesearchaeota archaeon]